MLWTAASSAVIGLLLIAVGAVCLSFLLAVVDGIWPTIIHTKVSQRFHARVIALNQMFAVSVVALGFPLAPWRARRWSRWCSPMDRWPAAWAR